MNWIMELIIVLVVVGSVTAVTLFIWWFEKWTTRIIKQYLEGDKE